MLTPYPLEPPPSLPPLDEPWEGDDPPLRSGRRVRVEEEGRFGLGDVVRVTCEVPQHGKERWCVALEEPCLIGQLEGAGPLELAVRVALGDGALHVERSADGATCWLTVEEGRTELLAGVRGGSLALEAAPEGARLIASGSGSVRLILLAAAEEGDRDRALRTLARKGFTGLLTQRRQHAERITGYGATLTTPDSARNTSFTSLLHDTDAKLVEEAGGRRTLPDPLADGATLLALGLREQVRDVLRALMLDAPLLRLFAEYARWAGDDDFVRKHWPRFEQATRALGDSQLALALLPVAEALGDHAAISALDGLSTGASLLPANPLPAELVELWGVHPDALDRSVLLRPSLPDGWREMTLERLRVGATSLSVKAVRRPGAFALKLMVTHGPAITVRLAPRLPFTPSGVFAQEEPLPGPEATFVLTDDGEVRWVE